MSQKGARKTKIENLLSQKIKYIYQDQLGHNLDNIYYKQFDRTLIIMLEGTITSLEKFLSNSDRELLAQQLREAIDEIIQPQLQKIIEQTMQVKVTDFLSDTTIESNLTGAIVIFELNSQANMN